MARPSAGLPPLLALLLVSVVSPVLAAPAAQFTWMYGASAERAAQLGLNTVYLPTTTTSSSLDESHHLPKEARDLARAAQARGLQVIIALPTLSQSTLPADPDDPAFREEAGRQIRTILRVLQDEPAVTAWAVADYPERELRLTPQGFIAFLQRRYGTLEAVNAFWGTKFSGWGEITMAAARAGEAGLPYGVGRASVDAADYQADALRRLLAFWADEVRALDPVRPLFTGRLALYRSVLSVPSSYNYVVPEAPVDVLEPDLVAGNVQAVDLARQGGAFGVVPSLRVPAPPDPYYQQGFTLARWLREAQLHGARGVALDGVQRLIHSAAPEDVFRALGQQMRSLGSFTVEPRPALAVLYEPYAEGREAEDLPLYGYLKGLAPGEPSVLMAALRLGSKFGLVDYLSLDRLTAADLDGYSAILAPCALHLPLETQAKLRHYVERGGRLICDFGAGLYEAGSWQALPPDLTGLCGVQSLGEVQDLAGDLTFGAHSSLFPSLEPPLITQGLRQEKTLVPGQTATTSGTPRQLKSWTFEGPMASATLAAEAVPLGVISMAGHAAPVPHPAPPARGTRPALPPQTGGAAPAAASFAGLIGRPCGLGWGAFCTGLLWARWDPADPAFMLTHGDLWGARAPYALEQPGLWPQAVEMCSGEDGVWLYNVSDQAVEATLLARDTGGRLFEGTFAWVPLSTGVVPMELMTTLPGNQITALPRRPVQVLPASAGVFGHLQEYAPERIRLELAGPGARVTLGLQHQRTLSMGDNFQATVVISSGSYVVAPGSTHRVKVSAGFGQSQELLVQADGQGTLTFAVSGRYAQVEISPEVASTPAAAAP